MNARSAKSVQKVMAEIKFVYAGLGQFGAVVSATSRFGDGTFRRWWSQMFMRKNVCFWNTL